MINYEWYTLSYGGTLVAEEEFEITKTKAWLELKNYTLKPDLLKQLEATEEVKLTIAELMDNIKRHETLLAELEDSQVGHLKGVKSESIKDHSVTFGGTTSLGEKSPIAKLIAETSGNNIRVMRKYLLSTGLLYRGV